MLSRLLALPSQYPHRFGLAVATTTAVLSDVTVQTVVEKRPNIDLIRTGGFGLFGFLYLGHAQFHLYGPIFKRLFPDAFRFAAKPVRQKIKDSRGMFNWFAQCFVDLALHRPLVYFPTLYVTKDYILNEKPDAAKALEAYQENIWDDCSAMLKVWGPATVLNFGFLPLHMRVPFTALVSYIWLTMLSIARDGDINNSAQLSGDAITGATFRLLEERMEEMSLQTSPDLDSDHSHVVITACGPDRVGIVTSMARAVYEFGGSVTFSRMVRLGQEFIMMIHVSVPHERKKELLKFLRTNDDLKFLNIVSSGLSRRRTGTFQPPQAGLRIKFIGKDRPGVLVTISERISEKGLNIENVKTEIVRNTKSGQRDFVVTADCVTPIEMGSDHLDHLASDFATMKEELQMDIIDVRLSTFKGDAI